MLQGELVLSPPLATLLFVAAVIAGYRYRQVWKQEGPAWQAWLYGGIALVCLLTVAFVPLAGPQ